MAGDWIKMRFDLQTHPKVVRISSALGADRLKTIGGLHAVWCLFDAHSEDGVLPGYSPEVLDTLIGWSGFTEAMASVGWLVVTPGEGIELPEFEKHNGQSAKRRAQENDRKRSARTSAQSSASDADKNTDTMRTREEKRREYINTPEVDSVNGHPDLDSIMEFWKTTMGKPKAKLTNDRRSKIRARLKEGFTPDDIKQAIRGCAASDFHMGQNDSGKAYNDITLICRNGSKLEQFKEMAGSERSSAWAGLI